eukprot:COSAG05_NODE_614_length_8342_cov_5.716851_1_plen_76_part_00
MSVFSKIDMFSPHAVDTVARSKLQASYGDHSHTKLALLVTKITYIKMDPLNPTRHGFANGMTMGFPLSFLCRMRL